MRVLFCLLFSIHFLSVKAQAPLYGTSYSPSFRQYHPDPDSILPAKKWFFTKYAAISSSYTFFRGGSASVISAPVGLQLNYRLTDNIYAFAGVSAAPAYINFTNTFNNSLRSKNAFANPYGNTNFGINPRAEMGLMYISPQKNFSISGSINIERNNYPYYFPGSGFQSRAPFRYY